MNNQERIKKLEKLKAYLEGQEIAISDTYSLVKTYTAEGAMKGKVWLNQLNNMMFETASIISSLEYYIGEEKKEDNINE